MAYIYIIVIIVLIFLIIYIVKYPNLNIYQSKTRSDNDNTINNKIKNNSNTVFNELIKIIPERFKELEIISKGGMGVVFKANDENLGRFVAIKMILPELVNNEIIIKRFVNEANSIAMLNHPNIIKIYDVCKTKPPYYVMEYLQGHSLEYFIKDSQILLIKEIKSYALQISDALRYCHENNIIHRDIKPANILIDNEKKYIKLVDFGIAKNFNQTSLTQTDISVGSPLYMAPEQLQTGKCNELTDIYSFALTLYVLITKTFPFNKDDVLSRITNDPIPLNHYRKDFDKLFSALIMRCIQKDPLKRMKNFSQINDIISKIKV